MSAPSVDGMSVAPPLPILLGRTVPVWVVLVALALGGFGIGTTEFVSMGLLPNISGNLGVSIPTGGHAISAYALGVVVGAPLIAVLAAKVPRRTLLIALMFAFAVGNGASALAPNFGLLLLARFVAGLPHGAYFGVACLVAASLVDPAKRARAVGGVMLGLSVANVAGVPAATWLGQNFGWRSAYFSVAVIGVATILALLAVAPRVPLDASANAVRELGALRQPQVLVALLVGTVGFGGMFAIYSYITPIMTNVAGLSENAMPIVLAIYGIGMVAGNIVGARLVDHSVIRSLFFGMIAMIGLYALFPLAAHNAISATAVLALVALVATTVVLGLQARLMDVAGEAQTLAASMNHAALNMGNAIGAWLGGLTIAAGWGWTSTAWVAVALGVAGFVILIVGLRIRPVRRVAVAVRQRREPALV
jgi:DHA1 family inner membrane transport protein